MDIFSFKHKLFDPITVKSYADSFKTCIDYFNQLEYVDSDTKDSFETLDLPSLDYLVEDDSSLIEAFSDVINDRVTDIVLVTGVSASGKSFVVDNLAEFDIIDGDSFGFASPEGWKIDWSAIPKVLDAISVWALNFSELHASFPSVTFAILFPSPHKYRMAIRAKAAFSKVNERIDTLVDRLSLSFCPDLSVICRVIHDITDQILTKVNQDSSCYIIYHQVDEFSFAPFEGWHGKSDLPFLGSAGMLWHKSLLNNQCVLGFFRSKEFHLPVLYFINQSFNQEFMIRLFNFDAAVQFIEEEEPLTLFKFLKYGMLKLDVNIEYVWLNDDIYHIRFEAFSSEIAVVVKVFSKLPRYDDFRSYLYIDFNPSSIEGIPESIEPSNDVIQEATSLYLIFIDAIRSTTSIK